MRRPTAKTSARIARPSGAKAKQPRRQQIAVAKPLFAGPDQVGLSPPPMTEAWEVKPAQKSVDAHNAADTLAILRDILTGVTATQHAVDGSMRMALEVWNNAGRVWTPKIDIVTSRLDTVIARVAATANETNSRITALQAEIEGLAQGTGKGFAALMAAASKAKRKKKGRA